MCSVFLHAVKLLDLLFFNSNFPDSVAVVKCGVGLDSKIGCWIKEDD